MSYYINVGRVRCDKPGFENARSLISTNNYFSPVGAESSLPTRNGIVVCAQLSIAHRRTEFDIRDGTVKFSFGLAD